MRSIANLYDLMVVELRNTYEGEVFLVKELKRLLELATDLELQELIQDYLDENEEMLMRIQQAAAELYEEEWGGEYSAIRALIWETDQLVSNCKKVEVIDAALVTALQHILHYQMASYGAICTYAKFQNRLDIADIIHKNLEVVKRLDRKLAILAEERINRLADKIDFGF